MPGYDPARPLIFLHMPKTAGIAVCDALVQAIGPPRVFFGFDLSFFGGFRDFETVAPGTRIFIHDSPASLPPDEKLVRAHMSLATLRAAYPDGQFLTVLREPVCRVISHFLFWRGFSDAQMQEWGGWADVMRLAQGALAGLLQSPACACQIDNVATRLLLWPHCLIPDDGFIPEDADATLLRDAGRALAGFDHAGAQEHPAFWPGLQAWVAAPFTVSARNVTPALAPDRRIDLSAELTPACNRLLGARTRLDQALWASSMAGYAHLSAELRQRSFLRFGRIANPP